MAFLRSSGLLRMITAVTQKQGKLVGSPLNINPSLESSNFPLRTIGSLSSKPLLSQTSSTSSSAATGSQASLPDGFARIALVRGIPQSFADALTLHEKADPIDVSKAREQHAAYVEILKRIVPEIIEIPADNRYPDCCFIEDTAVVRKGRALITRPGNVKRRGEVTAVREKLVELGIHITDPGSDVLIDGGDVLQGRNHIFVGLSSRTNQAGVEALRTAFPDTSVVALPVRSGLHLKSGLSWVGPNTLAVEDSPEVLEVFKMIKQHVPDIEALRIPDVGAANALLVNDVVLYPRAYPQTSQKAYESLKIDKHPVFMSEIHKADGGLTCGSILIE